jgi:spoIIIJ-associated protein
MDQAVQESVQQILQMLVKPICGDFKSEYIREGEQWRINLTGENVELLQGQKGELLNSIQHLIRVMAHLEHPKDRTHFILDINMARSSREKFINEQIPLMAKEEVLDLGMTIIIKNLSSYERRLIHQMLEEVTGLETMSVGEGNSRKLLIRPTSDTGSLGMDNSKIVDINSVQNPHLD